MKKFATDINTMVAKKMAEAGSRNMSMNLAGMIAASRARQSELANTRSAPHQPIQQALSYQLTGDKPGEQPWQDLQKSEQGGSTVWTPRDPAASAMLDKFRADVAARVALKSPTVEQPMVPGEGIDYSKLVQKTGGLLGDIGMGAGLGAAGLGAAAVIPSILSSYANNKKWDKQLAGVESWALPVGAAVGAVGLPMMVNARSATNSLAKLVESIPGLAGILGTSIGNKIAPALEVLKGAGGSISTIPSTLSSGFNNGAQAITDVGTGVLAQLKRNIDMMAGTGKRVRQLEERAPQEILDFSNMQSANAYNG